MRDNIFGDLMIAFVDVDDAAKVTWPPLTRWPLVAGGTITAYPSDGVRELFCGTFS
ncbi:MAG: hypothetical protein AAFO01_10715 [Pseudomonadota bacterium]